MSICLLDIWLDSDDSDRNNKTSVRSQVGAAVNTLPPHKYQTISIFAKVCVCGSQVLELFQ